MLIYMLCQGEEETVTSDVTRALIKGLPRLFIKYQTDEKRISDILSIPPLMNLDLYLEMRMMNVCIKLAVSYLTLSSAMSDRLTVRFGMMSSSSFFRIPPKLFLQRPSSPCAIC